MAFVLDDFLIAALVTSVGSMVQAWTTPEQQYPEQRKTEQEKWFEARVNIGKALVKRQQNANSMAGLITNKNVHYKTPGFDKAMAEVKATLPVGNGFNDSIATLQTAGIYDSFVAENRVIKTSDVEDKVESNPANPYQGADDNKPAKLDTTPTVNEPKDPLEDPYNQKSYLRDDAAIERGNDRNLNGIPDDEEA